MARPRPEPGSWIERLLRPGLHQGGFVDRHPIPAEHRKRIDDALRWAVRERSMRDRALAQVEEEIARYRAFSRAGDESMHERRRVALEHLDRIARAPVGQVREHLEAAPPFVRDLFRRADYALDLDPELGPFGANLLEALPASLPAIRDRARRAARELRRHTLKRGRSREEALSMLSWRLLGIWLEAARRPPKHARDAWPGDFEAFHGAVMRALGEGPRTRSARELTELAQRRFPGGL